MLTRNQVTLFMHAPAKNEIVIKINERMIASSFDY